MKLTVMPGSYSLSSDIKVEDIVLLEKHNPDALAIKDDDGNTKFAIGYVQGRPNIKSFGITFGATSFTDGKATITESLPGSFDDVAKAKEYVVEKVGAVVQYLQKLEQTVPVAANAVRAEKRALMDSIVIG